MTGAAACRRVDSMLVAATRELGHRVGGLRLTTYRIEGKPRHVLDDDRAPLPGHYEIELSAPDGSRIRRFLTDKGYAALLRIIGEGRRELSEEEFDLETVEPDLDALVSRMDREAGEGA